MGARKHRQGRGGGVTCPTWKCCEVFCALVVTVKRSVEQLFMHYFHNIFRRLLGALPPYPHRGSTPKPRLRTFVSRPLICPRLKKILRAPMHTTGIDRQTKEPITQLRTDGWLYGWLQFCRCFSHTSVRLLRYMVTQSINKGGERHSSVMLLSSNARQITVA